LIPENETETCYDFSGWQDTSKKYSCFDFNAEDRDTRINFCAARGSLVSPHNVSAKEVRLKIYTVEAKTISNKNL